eukprot:Awhi_evm1s12802
MIHKALLNGDFEVFLDSILGFYWLQTDAGRLWINSDLGFMWLDRVFVIDRRPFIMKYNETVSENMINIIDAEKSN